MKPTPWKCSRIKSQLRSEEVFYLGSLIAEHFSRQPDLKIADASGKVSFWCHEELMRSNLSPKLKRSYWRYKYGHLSDMHLKFSLLLKLIKEESLRLRCGVTTNYAKLIEQSWKEWKKKANAAADYTYPPEVSQIYCPGLSWKKYALSGWGDEF